MANATLGIHEIGGPQLLTLFLSAHDQNIQQSRSAATATLAAAGLPSARWRSGRKRLRSRGWCGHGAFPRFGCRGGFYGYQYNLIVLGVESAGFGAGFGFHCLFYFKIGRAIFFDDSQRAVAIRTESLHRVGIKSATVNLVTGNRK